VYMTSMTECALAM